MRIYPSGEKRRRQILFYCRQYILEHGYSPTIREISQECGGISTSHVRGMLNVMREQGVITFQDGLSRTIRVLYSGGDDG